MTEAHGGDALSGDALSGRAPDGHASDGDAPDRAPATGARAVDGLVDELELLEQQPLETRGDQLARIHDRLQAELGAVRG